MKYLLFISILILSLSCSAQKKISEGEIKTQIILLKDKDEADSLGARMKYCDMNVLSTKAYGECLSGKINLQPDSLYAKRAYIELLSQRKKDRKKYDVDEYYMAVQDYNRALISYHSR